MSKKRTRRARTDAGDGRRAHPANQPGAETAVATLSARRRWLYRAVIVASPWLFFLALELALRLVGYGVPLTFALRRPVAGETRYLSNPRFTWLFFDPNAARLVPPFSLALHKPVNTCRLFVFGSSAAQGDPEPGFGMARMIEVLLSEQYPGVDFEVINAATAAINSHVVYRMAREAVGLEPDLFVVYTGNNEVIGPYGPGTSLTAREPNLAILRASLALKQTRLGQLLDAGMRRAAVLLGRGQARDAWRGMEMFIERQVRESDPALERTYRYYEQNLTDLCRVAHRAGVPVVLSTIAVNLRSCAPFGSLHAETITKDARLRWDQLFQEGVRSQSEQRWADAAIRFEQASEIDAGYAELPYRWAQCEWNLGHFDKASRLFLRARDSDTLRFRADTRIDEIVRRVAANEAQRGVRLADAEKAIETQALNALPGDEEFLDHVHFTFAGNYRASAALLERVRESLPAWVRARDSGRPILGQEDCARQLVFTELDRYMVAETMLKRLARPPFTGQMNHAEQLARFSREMETLRAHGESGAVAAALREYAGALAAAHPHWSIRERYAAIQRRVGNAAVAEHEWRALADRFPQYPAYALQLARSLRESGKYTEAEASLRAMTAYQPESSLTLAELAKVTLLQGRTREAVAHARQAVVLDPQDANALYVLATCLCRHDTCSAEERSEAVAHLRQALEIAPDSAPVRQELAELTRH